MLFYSVKITKYLTVDPLNVHFHRWNALCTEHHCCLYGTPLTLIIFRTRAGEVLFPTFLKNNWSKRHQSKCGLSNGYSPREWSHKHACLAFNNGGVVVGVRWRAKSVRNMVSVRFREILSNFFRNLTLIYIICHWWLTINTDLGLQRFVDVIDYVDYKNKLISMECFDASHF